MSAVITVNAKAMGLTPSQALWDFPLSVILQLIHQLGLNRGGEYDWAYYGDPSDEILSEFEDLANIDLTETFYD